MNKPIGIPSSWEEIAAWLWYDLRNFDAHTNSLILRKEIANYHTADKFIYASPQYKYDWRVEE